MMTPVTISAMGSVFFLQPYWGMWGCIQGNKSYLIVINEFSFGKINVGNVQRLRLNSIRIFHGGMDDEHIGKD
jgi:hypothetical protein